MMKPTLGETETRREASARRLCLWVVALATSVFVLVPLAFNPDAIMLIVAEAFRLVKFKLLMELSAALLAGVLGAALLGVRLERVPMLLPALAFLGVSTLSTLFSGDIVHSLIGSHARFDGLLSLAAGVLLFYAAARFLDSWAKVHVFLIAGVTSAVFIAAYGIVQIFGLDPVASWGIPWYTTEPVSGLLGHRYLPADRASSTLGYSVFLAAYLTLMMGAALALYFRTEARSGRGLLLVALAIMGACWIYTYTRGAMLGAAAALPIISFLAYRRLGTVRPLVLPVVVVAAAILAAQLLTPQSMNVLNRFGGANLAPTLQEVPEGGDLSVTTRLLMWRDTIPLIMERPVLGHGPDNFAEAFKPHEGEDLRAFFPDGEIIDKAHNEFLQVAATTGLLGLAAYLWVFVSYFRHAYRSGGWPLLALSGGVLAYILQLQTAFTTIATGVTFWAILGVSVAIVRIQDSEGSEPPQKA
jgi:putative inorganic carbon (HCO3(-)) transporter